MEVLKECVLCNKNALTKLEKYSEAYLAKCVNCGMVQSYCKPTYVELQKHYDSYLRIEEVSIATAARFEELLDGFEKFRSANNIIDVGCGNGHFLAAAKKRGWNVFGTEYSDEAIKFCNQKGIHMQKGELNIKNYDGLQFDIVVSIEVIEHINYPNTELESFAAILRNGGLLYMTTPNFNSLSRYWLKEKWNIIEYPEHLCYYTVTTIHKLFKQHGFRKLKLKTTGISLARIKQASAEQKWTYGQEVDNAIAEKSEKQLLIKLVKQIVNFFLNLFSLGDTVKAWYIKG